MLFYHLEQKLLYVSSLKFELPRFSPGVTLRTRPAASLLQNDQKKTNHYPQCVNLKSEAPWLGKAVEKQPRIFMIQTDSFEASCDFKGFRVKGSTIKS